MIKTRSQIWYTLQPRLKTKWGQWGPYNNYCPAGCPAGCVIIAFAQALSHFQTIGTVLYQNEPMGGPLIHYSSLNWSQIIADCENTSNEAAYGRLYQSLYPTSADQVAHLCRYLGLRFNANYATTGTSANDDNALNYVKNYCGLSSSTNFKAYSYNGIRDALIDYPNALILVSAWAKKTKSGSTTTYSDGHTWIIDGSRLEQLDPGVNALFVHCNWGWNGNCDGYYLSSVFKTANGPVFLDSNDRGGTDVYNFQYKQKYAVLK